MAKMINFVRCILPPLKKNVLGWKAEGLCSQEQNMNNHLTEGISMNMHFEEFKDTWGRG